MTHFDWDQELPFYCHMVCVWSGCSIHNDIRRIMLIYVTYFEMLWLDPICMHLLSLLSLWYSCGIFNQYDFICNTLIVSLELWHAYDDIDNNDDDINDDEASDDSVDGDGGSDDYDDSNDDDYNNNDYDNDSDRNNHSEDDGDDKDDDEDNNGDDDNDDESGDSDAISKAITTIKLSKKKVLPPVLFLWVSPNTSPSIIAATSNSPRKTPPIISGVFLRLWGGSGLAPESE